MDDWFLEAVEQPGGAWACRVGPEDLGTVPTEAAAIARMQEAAGRLGRQGKARAHRHRRDGTVEVVHADGWVGDQGKGRPLI